MRIILDANVVLAYLGSQKPEQTAIHAIFLAAESSKLTLLQSQWTTEEIFRVAQERPAIAARVSTQRLNRVAEWIARISTPAVMPKPPFPSVCRDPNDDGIVATAIASEADMVVTLDRDLLDLGEYGGVLFMKPGAALAVLRAEGVNLD